MGLVGVGVRSGLWGRRYASRSLVELREASTLAYGDVSLVEFGVRIVLCRAVLGLEKGWLGWGFDGLV